MIKWLFKWLLRLGLFLAVVIVLLVIFKDSILRSVVEARLRTATGMDVRIGQFSGSFFSPVSTLKNVQIYNTAEFGGGRFLNAPELHFEYDTVALAQGKLRIKVMRLNITELTVVRNQAGETNYVKMLTVAKALVNESVPVPKVGGKGPMDALEFDGVDMLIFSFGKERIIDMKDPKKSREIVLNVQDMVFRNLRTESDLHGMAVMIYLQTNGRIGISPVDFTKSYIQEKLDEGRQGAERPAGNPTAPRGK